MRSFDQDTITYKLSRDLTEIVILFVRDLALYLIYLEILNNYSYSCAPVFL